MRFKIKSDFKPTGDQPEAIQQLADGINQGEPYQTLLGVTGSGKTFTVANVIQEVQRPTLVLAHNKTLAAQLYSEFSIAGQHIMLRRAGSIYINSVIFSFCQLTIIPVMFSLLLNYKC